MIDLVLACMNPRESGKPKQSNTIGLDVALYLSKVSTATVDNYNATSNHNRNPTQFKIINYKDRLSLLELPSLEERRVRGIW